MNQTAVSAVNEMGGRGIAAATRLDNAAVFMRAMRHSRRVRALRWAVPAALAVLLMIVTAMSYFDPMRIILARIPGSATGMVISGTKITMQAPKLSGYTRDQRWYELSARGATQDVTKPDLLELDTIRAKIETQDKSTMNLSAIDGLYDRKSGILTLGRNVVVTSSSGVEVRLNDAVVDTATGDIVSNKPVEVEMLQGTVKSNRLEVTAGGEVIRFEGNVVMNLKGQDEIDQKADKR
ncbi:MAG: LPS export ABC transporter periplasmic protein LptC [Pseudomonadota bacterium]